MSFCSFSLLFHYLQNVHYYYCCCCLLVSRLWVFLCIKAACLDSVVRRRSGPSHRRRRRRRCAVDCASWTLHILSIQTKLTVRKTEAKFEWISCELDWTGSESGSDSGSCSGGGLGFFSDLLPLSLPRLRQRSRATRVRPWDSTVPLRTRTKLWVEDWDRDWNRDEHERHRLHWGKTGSTCIHGAGDELLDAREHFSLLEWV